MRPVIGSRQIGALIALLSTATCSALEPEPEPVHGTGKKKVFMPGEISCADVDHALINFSSELVSW